MPVLIIGSGLVGSQIARILVEQGEHPIILDRSAQMAALNEILDTTQVTLLQGDILNPWDLARTLKSAEITGIIHTAAYPMLTSGAQEHPFDAIQVNIMGTTNVLEAARTFGITRIVVVSSSVLIAAMVGGEDGGDLTKEEALPRPATFYAATKQAVESISLNYAQWAGLDVRLVRYAAVAGPWSGRGGGEPTNIFRRMVEGAVMDGETEVLSRTMEWIYSKDAARGTVLALNATVGQHRVFNLSMGGVTSPQDMADAILSALPGTKLRMGAEGALDRPGIATRAADLTRSRSILGYKPEYEMADAIRDYAEWMRSHTPARAG